jgi:thioredoxin 1
MRLALLIILCLSAIPAFGQSEPAAILDFTATWCGPCQSMHGIVQSIKQDGIDIRTFDVDANKATAQRYSISNIPCFVVVDAKGHEITRITGTTTKETLVALMRRSPAKPSGECPYPAMVLVAYIEGNTAMVGSGTVVDETQTASVVITCAHGYTALSQIEVTSQSGKRYAGEILAIDTVQDVCVIRTAKIGVKPMRIAAKFPEKGESVWMAGFAGGTRFLCTQGIVKGYVSPSKNGRNSFLNTSCQSEQGCSGGPFLNKDAEIVATVTGGGQIESIKSGKLRTRPANDSLGPCLSVVLPALKCKELK